MNAGAFLVGLLGRSVSSAVLLREAARTSRRWQTYASRAGFSGVLLVVLLLGIWGAVSATRSAMVDVASLASLGRGLFIAFSVVQTLLALILAPLVTASAITEETDERTLEMLVLTRLRPEQILTAKILSRVLVLVTVVCGALPVMALVVNLGGVSAVEVVSVTVHTLTTVVVMSVLGAFFALFTRSPTLATAAAASYAVPFFALYPAIYVVATGNPLSSAHFSTFAAPVATDWSALLPPLSFLPSIALTLHLSAPLFQQKVSSASIQRAFSEDIWRSRVWGVVLAGWFVVGVLTLPWMTPLSYMFHGAVGPSGWAWYGIGAFLWVYFTFGAAVWTWAFLRVGMDVVDGIDAVFSGSSPLSGDRSRTSVEVGDNPIVWREARFRAWSSTALPMLMVWGFLLLGVFQTGWWIIPGGLLAVGVINTLFTFGFASWLATRSVAEERRRGTFELLLCTTLPARSILFGKALSALLPTAPMMALSLVLLVLGVPHLQMFSGGGVEARGLLVGLLAFAWTVPVWLLAVVGSMTLALRSQRPASAFGVVMVGILLCFGLPAVLARIFPDSWVSVAAGVLAPPLAGNTNPLVTLLSSSALALVVVALSARMVTHLRKWAGAWVVLLAASLAVSLPAEAAPGPEEIEQLEKLFRLRMDARPLADGFVREGYPTTIRVRLENYGDDTAGTVSFVQSTFDGGSARTWLRQVELPAGSRKEVLLDIVAGAGGEQVVQYTGNDGRQAVGVAKLQILAGDDVTIGVIGRDALGLPALLRDTTSGPVPSRSYRQLASGDRQIRVGLVGPESMPRHSTAWASLDWVVWPDADPSAVSQAQLDALIGWVADGGHLLLTVSDTWRQVSTSSLAPVLPVVLEGLSDQQVPLFYQLGSPAGGVVPVARGAVVPDAWVRARAEETPLFVGRSVGGGTVQLVLADLDSPVFSGLRTADAWRRLLTLPGPSGAATDLLASEPEVAATLTRAYHLEPVPTYHQFTNFESSDPGLGWEAALRNRLDDIPGVAPLPLEWLVVFAVGYLLVIGPLDYFVLRALHRQPWTWLTFPAWITVFSGVALYLVTSSKGSQSVMVRIEVLDVFPDAGLARGTTWLSVFSTGKTRVTVQSELADARIVPLREAGFQEDVRVFAGDGGGALSWHAETWTLAYARSDWTRPETGAVTLADGIVTNHLGHDLARAVVVVPTDAGGLGGWLDLGPLPDGASAAIPEGASGIGAKSGDERLDWVLDHFGPTVGGQRGTMDLEHRTVFVGLAEGTTEPLVVDGVRPEERAFTVIRQELDLDRHLDASLLETTIRFDAPLQLTAYPSCPDSGGAPNIVTFDNELRMTLRPGCSASISDTHSGASTFLTLEVGAAYRCVKDPQNEYSLLCTESE
jgi:ABC-type transport system involved in multi-copper enzyme maturation permease subunit